MSLVIDPVKWLKETDLGFMKPRGSQLKVLDAAIQTYHKVSSPENATKILAAFESWERQRGTDAAPTERDKTGAVSALRMQLKTAEVGKVNMTVDEENALDYMKQERLKSLQKTFNGSKVIFVGKKPDPDSAYNKLKLFVQTKQNEAKTAKPGKTSGQLPVKEPESKVMQTIKEALNTMVEKFFGIAVSAISGLADYLLDLIAKVTATVAPFVGHLIDAKDMIIGWGNVGMAAWDKFDISRRKYALETGNPKAAFDAVTKCLTDEIKQAALVATNSTLSFAAKTGAAFADGGAGTGVAIGIVSALAELARQIYNLAAEWRATKELKKILQNPSTIDMTIFKTYPLAGAYYLTSATLSDLIPISSFGQPGWKEVILEMKKGDFDKIYDKCEELIQKSAFEISGLPKRRILKATTGGKVELAKGMGEGLFDVAKDALLG